MGSPDCFNPVFNFGFTVTFLVKIHLRRKSQENWMGLFAARVFLEIHYAIANQFSSFVSIAFSA
jgi:hypothetical protein